MNVDLMLKVADYIEANPDQYSQSHWCGTVCCIAGHAIALSGDAKLIRIPYGIAPMTGMIDVYDTATGTTTVVRIPDEAHKRLGISESLAGILFSGGSLWPREFSLVDEDMLGRAKKAAGFLRSLVTTYQQTQKHNQPLEWHELTLDGFDSIVVDARPIEVKDSQPQEPIAVIQEEPERELTLV